MSGANAQPWEFIIIREKATRDKIVEFYATYLNQEFWDFERTRIKEMRHPMYADGLAPDPASFKDAPVIIVVCGDPRMLQASVLAVHFLGYEGGPGAHLAKAMANATQMLHLAAAALGLGSEWVSVGRTFENFLRGLLEVPAELSITTIVPVGYPAYEPKAPRRRGIEEITHFEKYDQSRVKSGKEILELLLDLRKATTHSFAATLGKL